jgi:hypothetical protein
MGILAFDYRMKKTSELRRKRKSKMTRVSVARRVAYIPCCSTTMMLLATSNLILTSAVDTVDTLPPRCVWRGKHTYLNCRGYIQCIFSQREAKSPMQQDLKIVMQLNNNLALYIAHTMVLL